jgi:hypothetical protein
MGLNFFGGNNNAQYAEQNMSDLQELERKKQELSMQQQQILQRQRTQTPTPLWDKIDEEVASMSAEMQAAMSNDEEFAALNNQVTALVQYEQLKLVKARVEALPEGKELLQGLLKATQRVKGALQTAEKQKYNEFEAFVAASAKNPKLTFEDFKKGKTKTKK